MVVLILPDAINWSLTCLARLLEDGKSKSAVQTMDEGIHSDGTWPSISAKRATAVFQD